MTSSSTLAKANETQVGGDHYKSAFQHWDYVALAGIAYLPAQVSKYLCRWQKKNGLQDLKKAAHFLDKFIEDQIASRDANTARAVAFCKQNDLNEDSLETRIIVALQVYLSGDTSILGVAREALAKKIERVESEEDLNFKEERDEWKTN
jgi:hypothetical protein